MEWIAIAIMLFLLYIGLNPVWYWCDNNDREYLLKKENYIYWLEQSYYVNSPDDLLELLEDEEVFEKYLKEHKLPMSSELSEQE